MLFVLIHERTHASTHIHLRNGLSRTDLAQVHSNRDIENPPKLADDGVLSFLVKRADTYGRTHPWTHTERETLRHMEEPFL